MILSRTNLLAAAIAMGCGLSFSALAQEPFVGEMRGVGFNFAPQGWASCNGQLLPISQNTALFSLLGTTYGGDGQTNFALPDMRSRAPLHFGQGPGLSDRTLGSIGGAEAVTLADNQMPRHSHPLLASTALATRSNPEGGVLARPAQLGPSGYEPSTTRVYRAAPPNVQMATVVGQAGGNQPHENMPPFETLHCIIALQGVFPSRP